MFDFRKGDTKAANAADKDFPDEYAALEPEYIQPEQPAADTGAPEEIMTEAEPAEAEIAQGPAEQSAEAQAEPAEPEPEEPEVQEPVVKEPEKQEPEAQEPEKPAEAEPEAPAEPEEEIPEKSEKEKKKENDRIKRQTKKKIRKENWKKNKHITPLILLGILLLIVGLCSLNILHCMNDFEVNFYIAESSHVTSDIRIVVVSDLHLREYGEDNSELLDTVAALHPDLIISAGDLVTYGESGYDNMLTLCEGLAEIAPFYGVMGNHEDEKVYLEGDDELRDRFAETGMHLLINTCESIRIKNSEIEIVGVSGDKDGFDNYGGAKAMESLDYERTSLRICVAHVPTLFKQRLEDYDFDIGIAGHTHGGVVRLPVIGGLYSAEEGILPKYDGGMYDLSNGALLFVSRGLGSSGPIPRFNNTPELGVIDVRWY